MNLARAGVVFAALALGIASSGVRTAWAAESGTLLSQTGTFVRETSDPKIDFQVAAGKSAGTTTKIYLEFVTEGNATSPPPDPNLNSIKFTVSKGGATSDFVPPGGADNTTFPDKVVVLTRGAENPADPRGLYVLAVAHLTATSAAESWSITIKNLSSGLRGVISIDQGTLTSLTPTGTCGSCSPCPTCQPPCPPFESCQPLNWIDWDRYSRYAILPRWPKPSPCLTCPEPWRRLPPEGIERAWVVLTPVVRDSAPLGPGRAKDIKLNVKGAELVGPVFDAGRGEYFQLIEFRKGSAPRVSASVGNVTSEEIVAGQGGVSPIFRTLTYLLGVLLILALFMIGRARGRAAGPATAGG